MIKMIFPNLVELRVKYFPHYHDVFNHKVLLLCKSPKQCRHLLNSKETIASQYNSGMQSERATEGENKRVKTDD